MEFYYLRATDIQGYEIVATGNSPKECLENAWKCYCKHFEKQFTKKEWFEWHGLNERSCQLKHIGDVWTE